MMFRRRDGRITARRLIWWVAFLPVLIWIGLHARYGGGSDYPDLQTTALIHSDRLRVEVSSEWPMGNVAVSRDGRIFFTHHPEASPVIKLLVFENGEARAFPSERFQSDSLRTPLGIMIDLQNRLWVVDHADHGWDRPAIQAFDIISGKRVYHHEFSRAVAPLGSYLNDLTVSNDGRYVVISDMSFFRKDPCFVVHDTETGQSKRRLSGHPSVLSEHYKIRPRGKDLDFIGGAVRLMPGLDGLVADSASNNLYYTAMSHSRLYRIPMASICNLFLSEHQLAEKVQALGEKPLCDGISTDRSGNVYLTDVEHGSIMVWSEEKGLRTLVRSEEAVRWPDGLSFGPNGILYFSDSALPDIMLESEASVKAKGPYFIYSIPGLDKGTCGR